MSLLRAAIGSVLRRLRQMQGRTLQDVADAAGVSMPYLSEIERGRKEASSEILAGICRSLGIGLPELLEQVRLELLRTNPAVVPPRCTATGGLRTTRCTATGGLRTTTRHGLRTTARHGRMHGCLGTYTSSSLSRRPSCSAAAA